MDDRVTLRVYYFGQILLQTSEGVRFSCEKPLDIVIPFTISFEELKGVICEKIGFQISKKISCMVYRYPIPVFGGFVQYQTKYVTDEASMQEMFSMYFETRGQISVIELYVEFEQSEADRNIEGEEYDSDSEEEFESNYETVAPEGEEDQGDGVVAPNVGDVANALANEDPFEEPSFMRVLDLEAMHAPEFPEYMSAGYSRTVCEYELRYQRLRERGEAYTNWLNRRFRLLNIPRPPSLLLESPETKPPEATEAVWHGILASKEYLPGINSG
ncbi:hypothetical protein Ahy_B04g072245 [Arachis hypogaea]|uniref:Uncharacterized protein n=1 Tax=Arachis hypogaea TaxID=3818 RepID=A0A444ZN15_ARAHY|nr:hypothetical protein Ahy_B04g072245 [Arachis hypogaea]